MVMGVFIAVLLVGMIYYVWGIGDAIMHRERMQDASDTAAFSAAVDPRARHEHARAHQHDHGRARDGRGHDGRHLGDDRLRDGRRDAHVPGLRPVVWGLLRGLRVRGHARHRVAERGHDSDDVEDIVESAMEGLRGYARGIRYGVPLAAQAKVVSYGTDVYAPVTDIGVMAPLRTELPAQDDETDWPCDEKVLPTVRITSPILVWLWGSYSPYMAAGIIAGELDAQRITRRWCPDEDGYFQRVTDRAHEMGNDEYQVQSYMLGSPDFEWTQKGVAVATWGEGEDAGAS